MAEKETGKQLNTKELFFNYTTEMACIAGFDGYFKELNPAWSRVLGWSTEELLSRPWNDFVHPDDVEVTESIKTTIVDGKEVFTFENRYICKDGTVKWLSWSSRPYPEEGIMFGVARDVTMLKNAEYELKKNEALLNEAQKITKLGSWNFDFRNDVLTWSDGLYDVFGVDRDTFKETHGSFLSLIDEDDRERSQKVSRHTQKTGEPFHILYRITTPKGERRQIEEYGFAEKDDLGNIVRLYGTAQDVTERIEIQEHLLNSDRIFRYASDMLCIVGFDGFFKIVNPAWTNVLGWSEEELLSKPYREFVHPDDRELTDQEDEKVVVGEGSLDFENRYLCKDGSYKWLSWKSFPFIAEQKVYAVVRDVTKQKEIEQGLVRLSTAVEQSPASIVITDLEGNIEYVNPAFSKLTGYTAEEAKGKNPSILKSGSQSDKFYKNLWKTITSGNVWRGELHNKKKNGELYWERATIAPVKNSEGEIINYLAIKEDITEYVETQNQLEENRSRLKFLSDNIPDGFVYQINTGKAGEKRDFSYISAGVQELFGITADEILKNPQTIYSKFLEDDAIILAEKENEALKSKSTMTAEIRFKDPEENIRWLLLSSVPRKRKNNDVIWDGIGIDITELKQAQEQIQQSEEKYRIVSENTYHWEFWEREDGSFIYNSPSCERITGYTVADFEDPELLIQIIHPDDRERYKQHRQKTWQEHGPGHCSFRIYHKNGDLRHVENVCQPVYNEKGDCIGIRGTNIDVTERKRIERKLIESEKRFREIFETLPVISVQGYNRNREVIYWNKASEDLYGYSRDEAMGQKLEDLIIPDEMREDVITNIQNWLDHDIVIPSAEITLQKKDGSKVYVFSNHVLLKNMKGEPEMFCIDIDLTELHEKTEVIEESELYHRSLIQTIPDMVIVFDKEGKFLDIKYSDRQNLMMEPSKFLDKKVEEIMPAEVAEKQMKATKKCLSEQKVVSFDYSLQSNGETKYFNSRSVAFGEDKVIATIRDITDYQENLDRIKQLLTVQEKQNEKLLNFTHIVSHNLRSHTANMQGIFSLLHMEEPDIFNNPYVELIETSAENLNETITNLNEVLEMSFGETNDKTKVNLHKTVDKTIKSVSTLAKEAGVSLYNEVEEDISVEAIPAYLESIVLNMLTNGIKFRRPDADSYVKVSCSREGSFLAINFEDNGVGIDLSRHREKLFGMYKTFHSHVESKGLGLFITKNQVEVMGGSINVESEVNEGTTFTINLPYEKV